MRLIFVVSILSLFPWQGIANTETETEVTRVEQLSDANDRFLEVLQGLFEDKISGGFLYSKPDVKVASFQVEKNILDYRYEWSRYIGNGFHRIFTGTHGKGRLWSDMPGYFSAYFTMMFKKDRNSDSVINAECLLEDDGRYQVLRLYCNPSLQSSSANSVIEVLGAAWPYKIELTYTEMKL